MLLENVIYTDEEGYKQVRRIPNGLPISEWFTGTLIGPPDLSSLPLSEEDIKRLNNALVDAGIIDFTDLNGRRGELLKLIAALHLENPTSIRFEVLGIFQRDYYPELFEDQT